MISKLFKILKYTIALGLLALVAIVFLPRKYEVATFVERPGTAYWELATGSNIGYTFIPASKDKQPNPIIYLHGGPGGRVGDHIINTLTALADKGYDLYFYDQVGSGHSARLEDISGYTTQRHQQDLEAIVAAIGAEQVIFIAQSWGAILATQFLADNPEQVEKIVFTGPGPIMPIRRELADLPAPDSLDLRKPRFSNREGNEKAYHARAKATLRWAYITGKKLATDREADRFFTYLNGELNKSTYCDPSHMAPATGGGGYYAHIMTVKSLPEIIDKRSLLKDSPVPILLMKGQCGNQQWGFAQEYLELFPNHQLTIIPNAGHAIAREAADLYLETIRQFLLQ